MDNESDAHMQMDLASQTGSTDRMELENGLSDSAAALPSTASAASASVSEQRDMDMEYGQPEVSIEDIQDSLKQDTEMSAEMAEQAHLAEEKDWKDVDADVTIIEDTSTAQQHEDADEDRRPHIHSQLPSSLEQVEVKGHDLNPAQVQPPEEHSLEQPIEKGQLTLEESVSGVPAAQADETAANDENDTARLTNQDEQDNNEAYADAPDSYEPYDKYASHSDLPVSAPSLGPLRRPALQKDYLAHVDVFHGHEPSASTSSPNRPSAPHVSLIYNNHEYSLFRQTSTPSGDDEEVLFGEREESQTDQQSLYYNSLEHFLEALHSVFPDMKGDGDTELTLDFGILDMQISEDNIYCSQLSLHDLDRIRVGMCQPELDRLQVTVKTGKRFAFRFNELAEHCYRMFAGSEDDSGTIFDETLDPLTGEVTEETHEFKDHETEGTATAVPDSGAVDETAEVDVAADYIDGHNIEDQEDSSATQNDYDDANAEAALPPADLPSSIPLNEDEVALSATSDVEDVAEDVHPPSDEHYDDPEFSQDVEENIEAYEEHAEDDPVDSEDLPVLQNIVQNGEEEEETVEELVIDPEASVAEAAQQVEEYEEATYDAEEAVEQKGAASTHVEGDLPAGSNRKVDVRGNEDADKYYENLTTPINEEVVLLEHPSDTATLNGHNVEISKAAVLENGHIEPATESDTRLFKSKRAREEDVVEDEEYVEGTGYFGETEVNETPIDAKRPKIAA